MSDNASNEPKLLAIHDRTCYFSEGPALPLPDNVGAIWHVHAGWPGAYFIGPADIADDLEKYGKPLGWIFTPGAAGRASVERAVAFFANVDEDGIPVGSAEHAVYVVRRSVTVA